MRTQCPRSPRVITEHDRVRCPLTLTHFAPGSLFVCELAPGKHMCNASHWLHVTYAGVPVLEGLVG
jgi:hypothetical protein